MVTQCARAQGANVPLAIGCGLTPGSGASWLGVVSPRPFKPCICLLTRGPPGPCRGEAAGGPRPFPSRTHWLWHPTRVTYIWATPGAGRRRPLLVRPRHGPVMRRRGVGRLPWPHSPATRGRPLHPTWGGRGTAHSSARCSPSGRSAHRSMGPAPFCGVREAVGEDTSSGGAPRSVWSGGAQPGTAHRWWRRCAASRNRCQLGSMAAPRRRQASFLYGPLLGRTASGWVR